MHGDYDWNLQMAVMDERTDYLESNHGSYGCICAPISQNIQVRKKERVCFMHRTCWITVRLLKIRRMAWDHTADEFPKITFFPEMSSMVVNIGLGWCLPV